MKKLVLTTLNSKFIHTSLALRSLKANLCVPDINTICREFTINEQDNYIIQTLYSMKADIYGFSCYIWNIEQVMKIVNSLKRVLPSCVIILGGPEVSYHPEDIFNKIDADIIVMGEGEITFDELVGHIIYNDEINKILGIAYKSKNTIVINPLREPSKKLDKFKFPYTNENLINLSNQIIYYESSRGCPFNCSYCLSSVDKSVRYLSLSRIKKELSYFMNNNVKQVKFVDRTFNCDKKRAMDIISYIIDNHNGLTNFHFEIAGDLLDNDFISLLNKAPVGVIQLEIGIQSTYNPTLKAVNRNNNMDVIRNNLSLLMEYNNIHIHLDLIAGLPYENLENFINSFNDVYNMNPHMLQLGFLKLLKGSPLEVDKEKYEYIFHPYPPYEIFMNKYISYDEIILLKGIEFLVDKYYNASLCKNTLSYIISKYHGGAFSFFQALNKYWIKNDLSDASHSRKSMYYFLNDYATIYKDEMIKNLLKFDYLLNNHWPVPSSLNPSPIDKEYVFNILKDESFVNDKLPHLNDLPPKEAYKNIYVEFFHTLFYKGIIYENKAFMFYKSTKSRVNRINDFIML